MSHQVADVNISEVRLHAIREECLRRDGPDGVCELKVATLAFRKIAAPINPIQAHMIVCKEDFALIGTKEDSNDVYGLKRDTAGGPFHISARHELALTPPEE